MEDNRRGLMACDEIRFDAIVKSKW